MIPKKIYRSWKTQNFHPKIAKQIRKMLDINPDYEQIIYNDEQIQDYVYSHYGKEISNAFNKLNIMTAKVDLWRYLILYEKGGIYLDIDSVINTKISSFLNDEDDSLITVEKNPELFVQWALFFQKNHPILERVIENVLANISKNKYPNDIINTTGPGVFTNSLQQVHLENFSKKLQWASIDESYDKKYRIKNSEYNYRIFGVDFNKNLSFKYKNTSYLYQGAKHWKKQEKEINLID